MPIEPLKPIKAYVMLKSIGRWYVSENNVLYRVVRGPKVNFYVKPQKGLAKKVWSINCDPKKHGKSKWLLKYLETLQVHGLSFSVDNGASRPDRVRIQGGEMAELLRKEGFIAEGEVNE